MTNVTFSGNTVANSGGGMYNSGSNPILKNSILWWNTAIVGPQIYNEAESFTYHASDDDKSSSLVTANLSILEDYKIFLPVVIR